jgi:S-adenosylmethionine hydrolase
MVRPLITLTTDFGLGSPYIAQMKGVILTLCREVDLVDISHRIAPQNIREGAVVLADATPRFPSGTVHVAVVDPGVGTSRRLIYAEIGEQRYLAPDNGLLSLLGFQRRPLRVIALENSEYWLPATSHTFHGRDMLAPVAARLAQGVDPLELGPTLHGMITIHWPPVARSTDDVSGQVLYVDSFGNLISNITRDDLAPLGHPARLIVQCGDRSVQGLVDTYGSAMTGELAALFDSQGRLEIAQAGGSAARLLGVEPGAPVRVVSRL